MSHIFAKTKDGLVHIVYSDQDDNMDLIPERQWLTEHGGYHIDQICCNQYAHADIEITDTNLSIVRGFICNI